jgi:ipoprotein LpqH
MRRGITAGAIGVAIIAAGLAGCSGSSSNGGSSAPGGAITTGVTIDGQAQNITGQASCTVAGDNLNVSIGDAANGVGAVLTNGDAPAVHSVGLGTVNGVTLGYADAAEGQGSAQATKDGNTYKITGTAIGIDTSSSQQAVTKPFEMDVACP